jgi:hypothetical protein
MREHVAFETLLFPTGTQFELKSQDLRAKEFMKDFIEVTDLSERLHSTFLKHKFAPRQEGLYFQILCVESSQIQINFPSRGEFFVLDLFKADVLKVEAAIDEIEMKILEAISPTLSPAELRSSESCSHSAIRSAVRGRTPSLFDDYPLFKNARLARTFPRGTQTHLSLSILCIDPVKVTVRVHPRISTAQPDLLTVRFTKKLEMRLPPFDLARDVHIILFEAMHSEKSVEVLATIAWDSSNGQPAHLEFIRFESGVNFAGF